MSRYPVLILATIVLSFQFVIVLATSHYMVDGKRLSEAPFAHSIFRFRVFWPLVFAVAITYYLEGKAGLIHLFSAYKVWRVPGRFYAFGASWKFLFCYLGWAIADLTGLLSWPGFLVDDVPNALAFLLRNAPYIIGIALVEETTWMKFCVTRLQAKYSALTSCVFTGIAWGLWYLPMLLLGEGVPDGVPWYMFLLSMVGLTVLLGWVYNMTKSGLLLLIMQIVSNTAFFVMEALPDWHDGGHGYVVAFILTEAAISAVLVMVYGPKNLGLGKRSIWKVPPLEKEQYEPAFGFGEIPSTNRTPSFDRTDDLRIPPHGPNH